LSRFWFPLSQNAQISPCPQIPRSRLTIGSPAGYMFGCDVARPSWCWVAHASRRNRLCQFVAVGRKKGRDGETPSPARETRALSNHRSEEHTSELQSPYDLVCRLLLEKKKKKKKNNITIKKNYTTTKREYNSK